jgi:glycosyltransferase involved in cell wall biosynthesis
MKRILMIAYSLYPYDPRLKREAEALVRHGSSVTFLVLMEGAEPRTYESNGVTVVELKVGKYRGESKAAYILSYLQFLMCAFLECTRRYFRGEADVIHVHNMPNIMVFAGIVPRLFGKQLILDIHDSIPETFEGKFRKPSPMLFKLFCLEERLCCAVAQHLICVNDVQRDTLIERGIPKEKITIILNVPDPGIFSHQGNHTGDNNKQTFDLVYHGTIDRMLGLDLVIESMPRLIETIPGLNFHVIGAGPYLEVLIKKAEQLGITHRVHFSRKAYPVVEMPGILDDMDIGIVPNLRNTATELMLPVKLMEYAAIGLPAVAPSLKAIRHYFPADMVTYFEPGNVASIIDAIAGLYKDKDRRKAQATRAEHFAQRYGWEMHQMDLVDLYRDMN